MKNIQWLTEKLPPVETITLRSEPDFYGASYLIASQLQKKKVPRSFAGWLHGWIFSPIIHVRQLAHWGNCDDMHLVATQDQVKALNQFGFYNSEAVGLPFIYSNVGDIKPRPNSLLVMPSHSLPYTQHSWDQETYVETIAKLQPYFSSIVACIHSSCVSKGYWISQFEKHGIPWITGALVEDKNAIERMHCIFKSFEYMTTNVIGSHVAYASYCGCKVSIYGTYAEYTEKDFSGDPFYAKNPDLLRKNLHFLTKNYVKNQYSFLFRVPMEASSNQKWGEKMLGAEFKKSAQKISDLLGWSIQGQVFGYKNIYQKKIQQKLISLR